MKHFEKIVILCGGQSGECEVSLHSAEPVFEALKKMYPTRLLRLDENTLPQELNPETDLIFPLIHGDFGEDGQLQALLEEKSFTYVGSDSQASDRAGIGQRSDRKNAEKYGFCVKTDRQRKQHRRAFV